MATCCLSAHGSRRHLVRSILKTGLGDKQISEQAGIPVLFVNRARIGTLAEEDTLTEDFEKLLRHLNIGVESLEAED